MTPHRSRRHGSLVPALIAVAGLVLAGCATPPSGTDTASSVAETPSEIASQATDTDQRIAENLVSIVAQLNELPPWSSTIQINPPQSSFGSALLDAFEGAGYGVQRVEQDQGNHYVSFRSSTEQSESGTLYSYSVWIGAGISIERRFRDTEGQLLPATPITVTGVRPKAMRVDDRPYSVGVSAGIEFPSGIVFRDEAYELVATAERTAITSGSSRAGTRRSRAANGGVKIQEILAPYRPKRQATLSFPTAANNVLGDPNKRAIVAISEAYDAATDVFLVSGCRPPSFSQAGDSEEDSLTRSRRVRAELLNRGFASAVILEESCEPGRYNQNLPRRAVVLTLERLRDT